MDANLKLSILPYTSFSNWPKLASAYLTIPAYYGMVLRQLPDAEQPLSMKLENHSIIRRAPSEGLEWNDGL
jgi:hypothetical protein